METQVSLAGHWLLQFELGYVEVEVVGVGEGKGEGEGSEQWPPHLLPEPQFNWP